MTTETVSPVSWSGKVKVGEIEEEIGSITVAHVLSTSQVWVSLQPVHNTVSLHGTWHSVTAQYMAQCHSLHTICLRDFYLNINKQTNKNLIKNFNPLSS